MPRESQIFVIGRKIGQLEQAQKDTREELASLKKDTSDKLGLLGTAVVDLTKEVHIYHEQCDDKFRSISSSLDDIRNPKISLKAIAGGTVKVVGYAGGAGGAFALVYSAFREVMRAWLHLP